MILAYEDLHVSVPGQIIVVVAIPKSTTCHVVASFRTNRLLRRTHCFSILNGLLEQFLLTYRHLGL